MVQDPSFVDGLRTARYFQPVDRECLPLVSLCPDAECGKEGDQPGCECAGCEFLAVLYKSDIQVAGIVIDGSATGITAYDFDMLLLNLVSVYLVPYVLVLADDDGRFVLPQHEDVVRKVLEQILLGSQVEPGIRVWIVDIKHYQR